MENRMVGRILDLYAARRPIKEMVLATGYSSSTIMRVLAEQRRIGDVRVLRRRRLCGGRRTAHVLSMLGCDPQRPEALAEMIWGDEWPSSWRQVVQGEIGRLRRQGYEIKFRDGAYVLK